MAHIKALAKSTVKYPMRSVDCKVYSIPAGARSHTHENLFLAPCRNMWCCAASMTTSTTVHTTRMYVDVRQIPSKPLQPNFDDNLFIRSYLNLFTSTGKVWQDEGNMLSRSDFRYGYTFYFDLTPDESDGACFWYKKATYASRCISVKCCRPL